MTAVFGTKTDKDGFIYEGEMINGKMHGQGKKYKKDGSFLYEGSWVRDKYQGKGREVKNNDIREGDWFNGKLHGKGKYSNPYVTYEGDWYDGKLHGKGKYTWQTGSEEGDFVHGNLVRGKKTSSSGEVEEGYFEIGGHFLGKLPNPENKTSNKFFKNKEDFTEEEILILYFAGEDETTTMSMNSICEYINQEMEEAQEIVKGLAAKGMAKIEKRGNDTVCILEYGLCGGEFAELKPLEEQKWSDMELRSRVCP